MGCARNRASELFSTKNSCLQYMLRVLTYCAALDVPTTTVRTVSSWLTARYLVGGPGWSGAGPADVGTVVLPLSVDDPGGAKVARGSRALVTADKGNGSLCVRSFAGVGAGPVVHRLALHPCSERWQERWISRTSRSSSVLTSVRQSTGPRP